MGCVVLQVYLNAFPTSPLAANLKACNAFRCGGAMCMLCRSHGLVDSTHFLHELGSLDYVTALGRAGCDVVCNDWLLTLLEQRRQIDRTVTVFRRVRCVQRKQLLFLTRVAKDCVLLFMQAVEWQGG
jgi:hypothetical protein